MRLEFDVPPQPRSHVPVSEAASGARLAQYRSAIGVGYRALSAQKKHGGQSTLHGRTTRSRPENPSCMFAVAEVSRLPNRCGRVHSPSLAARPA